MSLFFQSQNTSLLWNFFSAFMATGVFALFFNANKYDVLWGALLGGIGWTIYKWILLSGGSILYAYFLGAFFVAFLSEVLGIIIKNPATVFLIPGILPLVPGGGMFFTMRAFVSGSVETALELGYTTLGAAGAIALGIAIVSVIARVYGKIRYSFSKKA